MATMPSAKSNPLTEAHVAFQGLSRDLERTLANRVAMRAFELRLRADKGLASTLQAAADLREGRGTLANDDRRHFARTETARALCGQPKRREVEDDPLEDCRKVFPHWQPQPRTWHLGQHYGASDRMPAKTNRKRVAALQQAGK